VSVLGETVKEKISSRHVLEHGQQRRCATVVRQPMVGVSGSEKEGAQEEDRRGRWGGRTSAPRVRRGTNARRGGAPLKATHRDGEWEENVRAKSSAEARGGRGERGKAAPWQRAVKAVAVASDNKTALGDVDARGVGGCQQAVEGTASAAVWQGDCSELRRLRPVQALQDLVVVSSVG